MKLLPKCKVITTKEWNDKPKSKTAEADTNSFVEHV